MTFIQKLGRWLSGADVEFLTLKSQLEDERRARLTLESANASLQRENEFLRERFDVALNNERDTLKMLANVSYQQRYGMTPFPEAKGLPEGGKPEPVEQAEPTMVQGYDIVRSRTASFIAEAKKRAHDGVLDKSMVSKLEQWATQI